MPSIAEILANPAQYTPTTILKKLIAEHDTDYAAIVSKLASVGYKTTREGVHRFGQKHGLYPKKTRVLKGRPAPKPYYTRYSKLMGGKIRVPADPIRAKSKAYRRTAKAKYAPMFESASTLEQLANLMAKKVRTKKVAAAKWKPSALDRYMRQQEAFKSRFAAKYGEAPQLARRIAAQVSEQVAAQIGSYARPRRRGSRRIGSGVAMNPSFANPAFDFSLATIGNNAMTGAQTAAGAIAGIAGAKFANQFIVAPLAKNMMNQADAGIFGRAVASLLAGTILSTLSRAFIPGQLGDKMADGAFAGSVMYVAGGIKVNDQPLLPIGDLIQDNDGSYRISSPVGAYAAIPVSDEMQDNMSVGSQYDVRPVPADSDESEVAKGW